MRAANLAVMFVLELAVYFAVAVWALSLDAALVVRILAAVAAVLVMAVVWWFLGAPKAPHPVRGVARILLEVLWFGAGALALLAAGHPGWALVFTVVFVVNAALRALWRQSPLLPGTRLEYDG